VISTQAVDAFTVQNGTASGSSFAASFVEDSDDGAVPPRALD